MPRRYGKERKALGTNMTKSEWWRKLQTEYPDLYELSQRPQPVMPIVILGGLVYCNKEKIWKPESDFENGTGVCFCGKVNDATGESE